MKHATAYQHPTSYEAIVAHQHARHERRLRELKLAEKAIRAVSADLDSLAKRDLRVEVGEFSLYLVDHKLRFRTTGRSKAALYLGTGLFSRTGDRFVEAFIDLGWAVEAIDIERVRCQVLLRRPKTEIRIVLELSEEFAKTFQSREMEQ